MSIDTIDRILQAFDRRPLRYCRAEVDEAVTLRDEITPRLLAVLEDIATSPEDYDPNSLAHDYAVALLAHFREPKAHLPIIRAFSIDDESLEDIWGDLTTETLPILLVRTCAGNLDAIKMMVLDEETAEYVRWSAVSALSMAVFHGIAPREEVIGFLGGVFQHLDPERDDTFHAMIVDALTDLWPGEHFDAIKTAWDKRLIDPSIIDIADVEDAQETPKEEWLQRERERLEKSTPESVHDYISWFACFSDERHEPSPDDAQSARETASRQKKKAKRKMAAKSKKRNRR